MNILIYGDYILVKPQGLSNFISKICNPKFKSIIDEEYPILDSQIAIIEKVENENLYVRLLGELNPRKINPDDFIKKIEPKDYDIIIKSLPQKNETVGIMDILKRLIIYTPPFAALLILVIPTEILSKKVTLPNILIVLLFVNTAIILIHCGIKFGKMDKRYEKDLLTFNYKYENNDFLENETKSFQHIPTYQAETQD